MSKADPPKEKPAIRGEGEEATGPKVALGVGLFLSPEPCARRKPRAEEHR